MQHNNQESSLNIVKQMTDWINNITIIDKTHEEGYHIVCNQYNNFIGRLNQSKLNTDSRKEKDCCDRIINKLHDGINTCQNWFCIEDTMKHFQELKQTILSNKNNLDLCNNLNQTRFNEESEGGYVKTGQGNRMKFVRGKGGYVKTGYENKMEWVIGDGEWVKTGESHKMEWQPKK